MRVKHEWYAVVYAPEFRLQAALRHELGESPLKKEQGAYALCEKQGAKIRVT